MKHRCCRLCTKHLTSERFHWEWKLRSVLELTGKQTYNKHLHITRPSHSVMFFLTSCLVQDSPIVWGYERKCCEMFLVVLHWNSQSNNLIKRQEQHSKLLTEKRKLGNSIYSISIGGLLPTVFPQVLLAPGILPTKLFLTVFLFLVPASFGFFLTFWLSRSLPPWFSTH